MKKLTSILLMLVMVLSLTACGADKTTVPTPVEPTDKVEQTVTNDTAVNQPVSQPEESKEVAYPVTVTDQAGREVVIEKEPETLVSGYYISSSLLIALELDDKMVGIEAKADKRPIYKLSAEKLMSLPSVGSAKEFDLEGCAALKADLVILPLKLKDAAATLEGLGIKTILVNPESEDLLVEMIDIISTATNTVARGEEIKAFISTNKEMLGGKLSGVEAKNVYLAGTSSVLSTAGKKMYQNDVIKVAGGKNVAESIEDKSWADVDYEQILAWNPDYIIIAAEAKYGVEDVTGDAALAECNAVKNGNVFKFPSKAEAWDSPVPSGILGSVWMAGILHPDVVSSEESDSIIKEFYETFYEFKYE